MAEARGVVVLVATGLAGAVAGWTVATLHGGSAEPPPSPPPSEVARERDALREERDALRMQLEAQRVPAPKPAPTAPAQAPAPPPAPVAAAKPRNLLAEAAALNASWIEDALQIRDAAKRNAALEAIREALGSADEAHVLAGLRAVSAIGSIEYDRGPIRLLVRPHLQSTDDGIRGAAVWAFLNSGIQPEDAAILLPMLADSNANIRSQIPRALAQARKGDLTGEVGVALAKVLGDCTPGELRQCIGFWARELAPELEERLVALGRAPETRSDTIYYCLSSMPSKSPAVVGVLIDALEVREGEVAGRALWGLRNGVPPTEAPRAARAVLEYLESRPTTINWSDALSLLRTLGTEEEIAPLERLAENALAPEALRKASAATAEALRKRLRK